MNKREMLSELLELLKKVDDDFSKGNQAAINLELYGHIIKTVVESMKFISRDKYNHVDSLKNDYWYFLITSYLAGQTCKDEVVNSFMNINKVGAMVH